MPRQERFAKHEQRDELDKVTISMNRVTKVVKGGKNTRQAALVCVGDHAGRVGLGMGKAAEAVDAINKAETSAKRNMFSVPIVGTTIPHEVIGVYGCAKVLLLPAEEGTGVIAGGPVRAVLEMSGIKDIRAKSLGSNNPINCAKATIAGLQALRTAEQVAALRGLSVEEVSSLTLVDKK